MSATKKRIKPQREPCKISAPRSVRCKTEMIRACLTKTQQRNLYEQIRPLFDRDTRQRLGLQVVCPIYPQDPYVAEEIPELHLEEIFVDWEPGLADGPTSARFAVVDYNADTGELNDPACWDAEQWTFTDSEERWVAACPNSPEFRQVHLWATAQSILEFYEDPWVLGRPVPWAFKDNRLILVPHAGLGENAFYDRHSKSLQLYCYGTPEDPKYTCLSHDIIAHEMGHAILDGIRPLYLEHTSLQTTAFHEFVADLTAVLTVIRDNVARDVMAHWEKLKEKNPQKYNDDLKNFPGYVAPEFGAYCADRPYLRSAHNDQTLEDALAAATPHDASEFLTGTLFEIQERLISQFLKRNPKNTRAQAHWWAADRIRRLALQPLDYCPPVDIQFLDYARAVLRCYELTSPRDTSGYRDILLEVFHQRGFCDCGVWQKEHDRGECDLDPPRLPSGLLHHDIDRIAGSRTGAYYFLNDNRDKLGIPAHQDFFIADLYETHKWDVGRERLPKEIVLEYVWRELVELDEERFGDLGGQKVHLLCGGTLVFDDRGNVVSWFAKPGTESELGRQRKQALLDHIAGEVRTGALGLLDPLEEEQLGLLVPPVVARQVDGALRLETTPNLRDREVATEKGGGASPHFDLGGERCTTDF